MQSLQKVVLNKLQPGNIPFFIVSPNLHDGDTLAHTLSFHLKPSGSQKKSDNEVIYTNYFQNAASLRLLAKIAANDFISVDDDKKSLEYIIGKDFKNGTIWGLQLNYESFFELQIGGILSEYFCIFLYGTQIDEIGETQTEKALLDKLHQAYLNNPANTVLLHVNDTILLENIVLKSLPIDAGSFRVFYDVPSQITIDRKGFVPYVDEQITDILDIINKENLLIKNNAWFTGSNLLLVLFANSDHTYSVVINRLLQFVESFLYTPVIYVITNSEESSKVLKQKISDISKVISLNFIVTEKEKVSFINKIIGDTDCTHVIIDNLNLNYSISEILHSFKKEKPPVYINGNILADNLINYSSDKLALVDIISTRTFIDNISFSKDVWSAINGFDTTLDEGVTLWDFCIRALTLPEAYCFETPAKMLKGTKPVNANKTKDNSNYTSIFHKHQELYAQHINNVVYLSSQNQRIVQNEIFTLFSEVTNLNGELDKSNQDIAAITERNARLTNHVNYVESDRLFRISKKLKHFKHIFFKDSKTGTNNFKKILKFIIFSFSKAGLYILRKVFKRIFRQIYLWVEDRPVKLVFLDKSDGDRSLSYADWINSKLNIKLLKAHFEKGNKLLSVRPKISIIMPVYNPPLSFLHDAIKSVLNQFYDNWELCISDDCSPNPQIKRLLNAYSMKDNRIKVVFREVNGHISANSNSALELATGDYVLLLDHDDLLTPNCLFEVVKHINQHPEDKLIYSDEDKVDSLGIHSSPFFKPDWSPDKFLAINYISHVVVIERKLVEQVGGFRLGFEGSQDYDLLLRVTEQTKHIGHIPMILYNWRIHSASVASEEGDAKPYAYIAAKKALGEALVRRNTPGEVQFQAIRGSYRIKYNILSYDKVSILIPTKDGVKMLKNTIDSIIELSSYPNYEIIVLNNNSTTEEFFELMKEYKTKHNSIFKCVEASFPFNFSKLMNLGAAESNGEYILMLNNDVEIIHKDWITTMVSYAQHPKNGAIGVKLLYPDDTIQHAGTVIGLGDIRCAGHVFVGFYKDSPGYYNYLQSATNTSAVTAACLMCRRNVYEEVGGMEEQLEVEYNDVDFCLRILDKGYYNIYVPDVVLYHYESATRGHPQQTKEAFERHIREVNFFQQKWQKYIRRDPYYNPNLSLDEGDYRMNLSLTEEELSYK